MYSKVFINAQFIVKNSVQKTKFFNELFKVKRVYKISKVKFTIIQSQILNKYALFHNKYTHTQ